MIRYAFKSIGAHFRAGRTLFVLSVLGVALGVASVLSIQIINLNALGAFEGSVRAVSGDADFSVLPRVDDLDERMFPIVLADRDVAAAWPVYEVDVALDGPEERFLQVVGVDLFQPIEVPWEVAPPEIGGTVSEPGWVAVSPELAAAEGWSVGDPFRVSLGSSRVTLRVGALVDFRKLTPLAGTRLAVMDIAQAQSLFGRRGRIDRIEVSLVADADPAEARTRLVDRLGPSAEILAPEQRRNRAAGLVSAFRLNLTALSLISLFVGGFLVYVSTQASLIRRRNEIGLLRSLGTTRGQTLFLVLSEVALLGALGVALGMPLGYIVARLNVDVVSATLTNLYMLREIETLILPWWLYALAVLIGVGGALAGALFPALEISRKEPRALLAAYTIQDRLSRAAAPLCLAGIAVVGLSALPLLFVGDRWRPGGFITAIGLLIGLPLMMPWLVQAVTRRIRGRRFDLRYGFKSLGLRLQTTSFSAAALAVAVSMLIGITLMIGSFRRTVEIWITTTLQADVYVTSESWRRARGAAALDPDVVERLAAHPGVERIDTLRQLFVYTGERRISLAGVDMGMPGLDERFELIEGDLETAVEQVLHDDAVIIGEPLARKAGLGVGDDLVVDGPAGPLSFPVAAVFYDYSSELGSAGMHLGTMERAFGPGPITNVALYLAPDRDAQSVADSLRAALSELPLIIRSNRDIREEVFRIFDQTFAVTRLLQGMSLLIAACGITLTLIILARERVSELSLYRALGARRRQIFRIFLGKGIGIALFGLTLGSAGGLLLAMVLIFVINRAFFGWTIAVHWPWQAMLQQVATILGAALAASIYPALRASRTPATELSRDDV